MTDHFEAMFDSNYLRWFHLPEGGVKIKIKGVKKEEMQLPGSRDKSTKPVLHYELVGGTLEDGVKPLVLFLGYVPLIHLFQHLILGIEAPNPHRARQDSRWIIFQGQHSNADQSQEGR